MDHHRSHSTNGGHVDHQVPSAGAPADVAAAVDSTPSSTNHDDDHGGHSGHVGHGDHAAQFRSKFWLSLILSVPVVFFSPMFSHLLGYQMPNFLGAAWIAPIIGTVIFFYGGWPFLTGLVSELKARQPGMMTLISMAITVAFIASWVTSLGLFGLDLDFWWELALLIVIMLLGHWIEMRALGAASGALDALAALLPDTADRVNGDDVVAVPLSELVTGDVVLVRSGARVPADGTVVDGQAEVDESMVTGESRAVSRGPGDTVVAGTVATDSALRVKVTAVGADTALAGIQRLVSEAQSSSSHAQALADRAAAWLFYFASGAGIITFIVWMILGNAGDAVTRTVTVLVIACPHALGLAIPLVIAISTERAAKAGVLVKNRLALERMRHVNVVLFDKTGTLTKGEPAVTDVAVIGQEDRGRVLRLAAAVERDSEHPVARAIVRAADESESESGSNSARIAVTEFESLTGRGVRARIDGAAVGVGGPGLLREAGLSIPEDLRAATDTWAARGASILFLVENDAVLGAFALQDEIRPESREAIDALHARGVSVAMITGDAQQVADAVAKDLGIDEVFAEVLPQDKDSKVVELQKRGKLVAMVGDGVNDAPALARADVGIAIGAGTDVAIESAGVVLVSDDPRSVVSVIELSKASYRKMVQNLVWATGYNIISVPLAAGVLAGVGVVLSPAVAAILMSVSTVVVALNAQLLRRLNLDPARIVASSKT